jgi:hypothetical protein
LFLTEGNEGNEEVLIFVLFVSFCAPRFGAGKCSLFLITGMIMAPAAKNEKPTVGFWYAFFAKKCVLRRF